MHIRIEDFRQDDIIELLREHRQEMFKYSPAESVHALDIDGLKAPEMTFWSAWSNGQIAGCGGLKALDNEHGELKSFRTSSEFLRRGVAAAILQTVIEEAKLRGYKRLSLETGTMDAFAPAQRLYASFGFRQTGAFADYPADDPNSMFMSLELAN